MTRKIGYLIIILVIGTLYYLDGKDFVPYVTALINWYILFELIGISEKLKK